MGLHIIKNEGEEFTKEGILSRFSMLSKDALINLFQNNKSLFENSDQDCKQDFLSEKGNNPEFKANQQVNHIIPLAPPMDVRIPELYVIMHSGHCLFHFDFMGSIRKEPIDDSFVSSFLSAMNMFAQSMGWKEGVSSLCSGHIKALFAKGKFIYVVLVSYIDIERNIFLIDPILIALAEDLCSYFENKYQKDLIFSEKFGVCDGGQFKQFTLVLQEYLINYRKQIFELYQKLILVESLYNEVPEMHIIPLMNMLTANRTVIGELAGLMVKFDQVKAAIRHVNANYRPVWELFSTPMYNL